MLPVATSKTLSAEDAERQRTAERQRKTNDLTHDIIAAAIKVHGVLGPGLLESAYEACLGHELHRRGHQVRTQVTLPVIFEGLRVDLGYRIDMLVDDEVIVELKAQDGILPIHRIQLTSYLRLSGKKVGLLMNFHCVRLVDGVTRIVNDF